MKGFSVSRGRGMAVVEQEGTETTERSGGRLLCFLRSLLWVCLVCAYFAYSAVGEVKVRAEPRMDTDVFWQGLERSGRSA